MTKKHQRGKSLHETHPSGGDGGAKHREPHPSGQGPKKHTHRGHSAGGKITGNYPKEE